MKIYVSFDKVAICEDTGVGGATRCISATHDVFIYAVMDYLEQLEHFVKQEEKWVIDHVVSALEQLLKVIG